MLESRHVMSDFVNTELGYVKIFRSICDWEWYKDPYVVRVFLHCLLSVSSKDYFSREMYVKKGMLWTSRRNIAKSLDITEYRVRQALEKLIRTGEITCRSSKDGICISIVNWNFYQCESKKRADSKGNDGWSL